MNAELLRKYLKMHRKPITKYQDATVVHKELCQSQPEFYMELLKNNLTHLSHKQEIFLNIISLNCNSLAGPQTAKIVTFLQALPIEQSLQLIDILPKLKVNCSRIRNLGMNYLLGHESFATLAATKSLRIQRLLKHFLGERTWSACKRFLKNPGTHGKKFLHHKLWRYANNIETTHEALCFLAKVPYKTQEPLLTKSLAARKSLEQGKGLPLDTLFGLRGTLHPSTLASKVRSLAASISRINIKDNPLTTLYKEVLSTNITQAEHYDRLPACLDHAVKNLPIMDQKVAIILDISSSMASSGERSQHPAGLGLALTRILQKQFPVTSLYQVGGTNNLVESAFAFPQGQTDLASSLLEAVSRKPDSVMFITDGYENTRQGDVADVVTGMRQIAINTPIYQIVPLFTHTEDLTQRTLSADIEVITIAHETEISDLFAHVLLEQTQDVSPNKLQLCKQLLTRS